MDTALFDSFAAHEDRHWWFNGRKQVLLAVVDRYLKARPARVLDVGCGTGFMLEALQRFGRVEGLETSEVARAHCKSRLPGVHVFEQALPDALPDDAQYDLVTAFDVLEHIEDPLPSLRRIHEALSPEGLFVCSVPAFRFLWSQHDEVNEHFRRYTAHTLTEQLALAGLTVEAWSYFNSALFPAVAAVRLLQKLWPSRPKRSGDLDAPPPGPVNAVLEQLFSAERALVGRVNVPFGVSLWAVARR